MADRYQIRPSSLADVPALARLEIATFSDPWTPDQLVATMSWEQAIAKVAETEDGQIVGHLIGRLIVDQGEILTLATDPAHRREGIATRLLDDTLEDMQQRGVASVWLEVRHSNTAAQALYQARGFVATGRRRGYYRHPVEDALILRRDFRSSALPGTAVR